VNSRRSVYSAHAHGE